MVEVKTMPTYEVWYMKPESFRDMIMGSKFVEEHAPEVFSKMTWDLSKTHTFLKEIDASGPEEAFHKMQAENWSPNGEARELILSLGLGHTSMTSGDILRSPNHTLFAEWIGFTDLGPSFTGFGEVYEALK
jgi:hypothetical protein